MPITLSTPTIFVNNLFQSSDCLVTNVGTTPAEVSVELFDEDGLKVVTVLDQCAVLPTQDPHRRCRVFAPEGVDVSCVIQSPSRNIRGALELLDTPSSSLENRLVAVVPATAK
jgi:hypothetical protein